MEKVPSGQSISMAMDVDSPLYGRNMEISIIREYIMALDINNPGMAIILEGEAGIGKTRIAKEAIAMSKDKLKGNVYFGAGKRSNQCLNI
jgi:predicted ATPase